MAIMTIQIGTTLDGPSPRRARNVSCLPSGREAGLAAAAGVKTVPPSWLLPVLVGGGIILLLVILAIVLVIVFATRRARRTGAVK